MGGGLQTGWGGQIEKKETGGPWIVSVRCLLQQSASRPDDGQGTREGGGAAPCGRAKGGKAQRRAESRSPGWWVHGERAGVENEGERGRGGSSAWRRAEICTQQAGRPRATHQGGESAALLFLVCVARLWCVCVCLRVVLCVQNEAGERGRGVFAAKAAPEGAARSAKGGKAHAPSASGVLRVR